MRKALRCALLICAAIVALPYYGQNRCDSLLRASGSCLGCDISTNYLTFKNSEAAQWFSNGAQHYNKGNALLLEEQKNGALEWDNREPLSVKEFGQSAYWFEKVAEKESSSKLYALLCADYLAINNGEKFMLSLSKCFELSSKRK